MMDEKYFTKWLNFDKRKPREADFVSMISHNKDGSQSAREVKRWVKNLPEVGYEPPRNNPGTDDCVHHKAANYAGPCIQRDHLPTTNFMHIEGVKIKLAP